MGLDPTFSEAFIHRLARPFDAADPWSAHRVAGRRLRPFSLWHLLLLQQVDSPLLTSPARLAGEDLLRAVSICRCRYLECDVRAGWSPRSFWKLSGRGLAKERAALLDYVDDFLQRPECSLAVIGKPGKSIRLGPPPETLAIASTVIFATHWPERAVWEMPVGAAYWYEALARRQKDPIDFMTPEEREWQDELDATGFRSWEPKAGWEDKA